MNKYRVTVLSYGLTTAYLITATDIISALTGGMVNLQEVVSVELIGSNNVVDVS